MTETEQIDKYILDHIAPEGGYLYRLYRATNIHTIHGRMASGHLQGRLLKMLRPGGYILADNTLWDGHVTDKAYEHDHQTQGICKFNDFVANDTRVENVILPLRDGLTIVRKK